MKTPRRYAVLLAATCVALLTGFLSGPMARTSSAPGSPPAAPSSVEALTTRARPVPLADLFPELGPGTSTPAVSAGRGNTCLVTSGGGVQCWGAGPLGDGTVTSQGRPVHVARATSGMGAVVSGHEHTCVLSSGGRVQCWGANSAGQLGDGTTIERVTPVDVTGLTGGVQALSAGGVHTCALTGDGTVQCWGVNEVGALGDGTKTSRATPVTVTGLPSGVQAIAAGGGHTCALTGAGGVLCWGWNKYGQLGDGSTTDQTSPVPVVGLSSGVRAIAAGYAHTCALNADGHVSCWGANPRGQLGDGTTQNNSSPVTVAGLTAVAQALSAGGGHTCAILSGGGVSCWGDNADGQLGDGTNAKRTGPIAVTGLTSVQSVAAGWTHTCAVTGTGAVLCWGSNEYGQLGDGTKARIRAYPVAVLAPRTGTPPSWVEQYSVFSDPAAANYWWIGCDATGCGKIKGTTYVIETKQPISIMYWATDPDASLRTATLTLDVASMSGGANPYLGLACMITGNGTSHYEIDVTSNGYLFFLKNAKGKFTNVQDPIRLSGFDKKKPPRLIFGCESRPEGVLLSALIVDARLFTALDKKPLKTGGAALNVGNVAKGTSSVAFREIDVVGELKS